MEKGKCNKCNIEIMPGAFGMCWQCARQYWEQHDKDFPFIVKMGNGDSEVFATKEEADKFADAMRAAYVERR